MTIILPIIIVCIVILFFAAGFQHALFFREWFEQQDKSLPFIRLQRLSTTAIFSLHLSEKLRQRRRRFTLMYLAVVFLIGVLFLLNWLGGNASDRAITVVYPAVANFK